MQSPLYVILSQICMNRGHIDSSILLSFLLKLLNQWCCLWYIAWTTHLMKRQKTLTLLAMQMTLDANLYFSTAEIIEQQTIFNQKDPQKYGKSLSAKGHKV